jgi:hypothetical protein
MADKKISALTASSTPLAGTEVLPIVQSGATVKVAVSDLTAGRDVNVKTLTASTTIASSPAITISSGGNAQGQQFTQNQANVLARNYAFTMYDAAPGDFGIRQSTAQNGNPWSTGNFVYRITYDGTQTFSVLGSDALVVNANVTVSTGNLVIGTSGKGIDFSATPGTGTSELFADYEEGSWTPTVIGSTSAGTATYSIQVGTYTRIGNKVFITCKVVYSSFTGTGNMDISGLPVACKTLTGLQFAMSSWCDGLSLSANNFLTPIINSAATKIELQQSPTGGGSTNYVPVDAAAYINVSGFYEV